MFASLAPVSALLLSAALLLMGNGLQSTLLPVRGALEGFSAVDIGILGSAYYVGFGAGCLLGARAVSRAGHIRTFAAMVSLASTVALAHALVLEPMVWWFARAASGFCVAVLFMVIESWLNERATNETRGFVFSVYTIVNLTVVTLGQMMLTLADPWTFVLFAVSSMLVSVAAIPVAMTRAQAPAPIATVKIRFFHLYRLSPVGVIGCLAVGLANGAFWSLAPVYAQVDANDTDSVAIFMSVAVIAGAIGQFPLGRASDRMDRRRVIVATCALAAAAGLVLALFADAWAPGRLAFGFLFGLFALPVYALCAAHMNDNVEGNGFIEAAGGLLLLFAAGAAVGPIIASGLMRSFGVNALFFYTAAVHVLFVAFTYYRMGRRAAPTERTAFSEAAVMAQTVSNFDPLAPQPEDGEDAPPAEGEPGDKPEVVVDMTPDEESEPGSDDDPTPAKPPFPRAD